MKLIKEINPSCFGCGPANPIGLKLEFKLDGDELISDVCLAPDYQGWPDVAHGGIVVAVLDELMSNHLFLLGYETMTAEIKVRFIHPVPVGVPLRARSRVNFLERRLMRMEARLEMPTGQVLARGEAKMMPKK